MCLQLVMIGFSWRWRRGSSSSIVAYVPLKIVLLPIVVMKTFNDQTGARIRARREQMNISVDDLAQFVDINVDTVSAIEEGKQQASEVELTAISQFLIVNDDYLTGNISLADVVEADNAATDVMVAWIAERFRRLPNQTVRQVVYAEIKEIIDVSS